MTAFVLLLSAHPIFGYHSMDYARLREGNSGALGEGGQTPIKGA